MTLSCLQVLGREFCQECDFINDPNCLQRQYLCGHYNKIIEELSMHTILKDDDYYFLGASYYGIFHELSGIGIKCYMAIKSQNNIKIFLAKMYEEKYQKTGRFGDQISFMRVKESLSILQDLEKSSFCSVSHLTKSGILSETRLIAYKEMENIFFQRNQAIADSMSNIFEAIRSIISKSSEFEGDYFLKMQESELSNRYLLEIEGIMGDFIGSISKTKNRLQVNNEKILSESKKVEDKLKKVEEIQKDFQEKLGGITPERYEEMRLKYLDLLNNGLTLTGKMIDYINDYYEKIFKGSFFKIKEILKIGSNESSSSIENLESMWRHYGKNVSFRSTCKTRPNLWFCKEEL